MLDDLNKQLKPLKAFHASSPDVALRELLNEGYSPIYAAKLAFLRASVPPECPLWGVTYTTPSLVMKGKTRGGLDAVVVAHVPNYLSNPDNIESAIQDGLVDGYAKIPPEEFYQILEMENGKNVFVLSEQGYENYMNSHSGNLAELGYLSGNRFLAVRSVLLYPAAKPFLGGRKEARDYITAHKRIYGSDFGIRHLLPEYEGPVGGFLSLGSSGTNSLQVVGLDYDACFIGIPKRSS